MTNSRSLKLPDHAGSGRSLNGQAADLESIRSHVAFALTAGGAAAAVLATKSGAHAPLYFAYAVFAVIGLVAAWTSAR